MRDYLNQFIPIIEDDMNGTDALASGLSAGSTGINYLPSSNCYYGYQPLLNSATKNTCDKMEIQDCHVDIQFNNYIEKETQELKREQFNIRKRPWDYAVGEPDMKKRREGTYLNFIIYMWY